MDENNYIFMDLNKTLNEYDLDNQDGIGKIVNFNIYKI